MQNVRRSSGADTPKPTALRAYLAPPSLIEIAISDNARTRIAPKIAYGINAAELYHSAESTPAAFVFRNGISIV